MIARLLSSKRCNSTLTGGTISKGGGLAGASSIIPRLRIVALHDVYELQNLPKLHTFLSKLSPRANVVCLAGDFLSSSSTMSAMDGGRSMVAALKKTGITHACLGNKEADLRLSVLCKRLKTLSDSVVVLNTNVGVHLGLGQDPREIQKQALIHELLPSYEPQSSPTSSSSSSPSADLIHELLPSYEPQSSSSKSFMTTNTFGAPANNITLSSDASYYAWLNELLPSHHVVTTPCQRVRIGLLGLLSDEACMFRDGTFRGAPIHNVLDAFTDAHQNLVVGVPNNKDDNNSKKNVADWLLPITHQTMARDADLARRMLEVQSGSSIILGGHEHTPMDVMISSSSSSSDLYNDSWVRILKSATEARAVSLVDLSFDVSESDKEGCRPSVRLGEVQASLVEVTDLEPSVVVQKIVDSHRSLQEQTAFQGEDVLHAAQHFALPPNVPLSSCNAKYQQTTVGGVFCTAIKEELQVDVALLPGSALHGNVDNYYNATMTYGQLKRELFGEPIKMVIVPMKRWQVQAAVAYSRQRAARAAIACDQVGSRSNMNNDGEVHVQDDIDEDNGYGGCLQVDMAFESVGLQDTSFSPQDELRVALPRNVLEIYCQIKQGENQQEYLLHNLGDELHEHGDFPADDEFWLADHVITRHCSKYRWYEIIMDQDLYTTEKSLFQNLDNNAKGYLTRQDVKRMLTKVLKHEPSDHLVKDMMDAIDANENGIIDPGEFSHLLAVMEQEHGRGLS